MKLNFEYLFYIYKEVQSLILQHFAVYFSTEGSLRKKSSEKNHYLENQSCYQLYLKYPPKIVTNILVVKMIELFSL